MKTSARAEYAKLDWFGIVHSSLRVKKRFDICKELFTLNGYENKCQYTDEGNYDREYFLRGGFSFAEEANESGNYHSAAGYHRVLNRCVYEAESVKKDEVRKLVEYSAGAGNCGGKKEYLRKASLSFRSLCFDVGRIDKLKACGVLILKKINDQDHRAYANIAEA
jgi:hypothetical protein